MVHAKPVMKKVVELILIKCAAKEWTFGIGAATTGGANVIIGKTYTNEEIADQYAKDLRKVSKCIIDYYPYNEMNQNQ